VEAHGVAEQQTRAGSAFASVMPRPVKFRTAMRRFQKGAAVCHRVSRDVHPAENERRRWRSSHVQPAMPAPTMHVKEGIPPAAHGLVAVDKDQRDRMC